MEEFFNRLTPPYSITYAERLAERCPPDADRAAKDYKGAKTPPKAARSGPKSTSLSETSQSDAVGPFRALP